MDTSLLPQDIAIAPCAVQTKSPRIEFCDKSARLQIMTVELPPATSGMPQSLVPYPNAVNAARGQPNEELPFSVKGEVNRQAEGTAPHAEPNEPFFAEDEVLPDKQPRKDTEDHLSRERTSVSSTSGTEDEDVNTNTPLTSTTPSECGITEPSTTVFSTLR